MRFHDAWRRGTLSREQKQILRLAARGYTHPQMAPEIGMSEATLEREITRLRARLGMRRRETLPAKAIELGFSAR